MYFSRNLDAIEYRRFSLTE